MKRKILTILIGLNVLLTPNMARCETPSGTAIITGVAILTTIILGAGGITSSIQCSQNVNQILTNSTAATDAYSTISSNCTWGIPISIVCPLTLLLAIFLAHKLHKSKIHANSYDRMQP